MAKGRKRKIVFREPNGRASRKGLPRVVIDKGTDRMQEKAIQFGTQGTDAIGRAYMAGLLGDNADVLRDTARKIFRAYWPMLEVGRHKCTLNDTPGGANDNFDPEAIKAREKWLNKQMRIADEMGRTQRKVFDQLAIDPHPDHGPAWLDSLIWHKARNKPFPASDLAALNMALDVLRALAT